MLFNRRTFFLVVSLLIVAAIFIPRNQCAQCTQISPLRPAESIAPLRAPRVPVTMLTLPEIATVCHIIYTKMCTGQEEFPLLVEARLKIFQTITLPSIKNQTWKDFHFLINIRPVFPLKQKLLELVKDDARIHIVIQGERNPQLPSTCTSARYTTRTRLDSDDAMHVDTLRQVRSVIAESRNGRASHFRIFIVYPFSGYTWNGKEFYEACLPMNTIGQTEITHIESGKMPRRPMHLNYATWLEENFKECRGAACMRAFPARSFLYTRTITSSSRSSYRQTGALPVFPDLDIFGLKNADLKHLGKWLQDRHTILLNPSFLYHGASLNLIEEIIVPMKNVTVKGVGGKSIAFLSPVLTSENELSVDWEHVADSMIKGLAAEPKADIYDIGTYSGYYSLLAASHGRKVFSWEPQSSCSQTLRTVVKVNNLTPWLEVLEFAASNRSGVLFRGKRGPCVRYYPKAERTKVPVSEAVTSMSIDDSFQRTRSKKLAWVKIDTGGEELHVLQGAQATLASGKILSLSVYVTPRWWDVPFKDGFRTLLNFCRLGKFSWSIAPQILRRLKLKPSSNFLQLQVASEKEDFRRKAKSQPPLQYAIYFSTLKSTGLSSC